MKKGFSMMIVLLMILSTLGVSVFATEDSPAVYVTISDYSGEIVLALQSVTVTDADRDGTLTVNDALYLAHEEHYNGGAAEGYASSVGAYGLQLDKLWGVANGGSYGFYVNNVSANGLGNPISDGDHVRAYVYTDLTTWSDKYAYFNVNSASVTVGQELELTVMVCDFDASYNSVTYSVANAVITLDGEEQTSYRTDSEGKVRISLESEGSFLLGATSETLTLVSPVCKVTVTAAESTPSQSESASTETVQSTPAQTTGNGNAFPEPSNEGNFTGAIVCIVVAVVIAVGAVVVTLGKSKKTNEK